MCFFLLQHQTCISVAYLVSYTFLCNQSLAAPSYWFHLTKILKPSALKLLLDSGLG